MAGYLDDLIKDEPAPNPAPVPAAEAPEEEPKGPTGKGGDARASLYGSAFMEKYGARSGE